MPARNTVKFYFENTFYHVYNRGVDGRSIFCDENDYKVFLGFIKRYLTPKAQNEVQPRWRTDIIDKLYLVAYCLMPNHFHLLIKQTAKDGSTIFMRALMNSYVRYFNKKYKRVGGLFQGIFKAVPIDNESYLLHLTRYIHLNPLDIDEINMNKLEDYYCSYGEYIGKRKTHWINCNDILENFGSKIANMGKFDSYKDFIEKFQGDSGNILGGFKLE